MSWDPPELKEYVDHAVTAFRVQVEREFHCLRESIAHALDATKRADEKADRQLDTWKASQNEWRQTFSEWSATGVTRREWDVAHQLLVRDLDALRRQFEKHLTEFQANKATAARTVTLIGVVAAVFSTVGGALVAILHYLNAAPVAR